MKNQTVVITGGSSGMGKYMARRFFEKGANVVICGRNEAKLRAAKNEISGENDRLLTVAMDVRCPEEAVQLMEKADQAFGSIHVLINNAAGNFICPTEKLTPDGWQAVIDIVLNGTFYCSHAAGNYWIKRKSSGLIINMAAAYAWNAGAKVAHSAAAKAGVLSLTRTLAVEWGYQYGIRVNAIAPGPIERTGGAEKLWESSEAARRTLNSVPLGRLGTPEEVASLALFLCSKDAAYINGECITIDGGQWLNRFPF
ncbi:2,4-dienoyl-CoA reductase [Domibacillus indicus]|uniref:2,4-dienoyl-CoA reductase n=1 Tax=Domibacillus indicus TaxID=1437523 RepID=UPI00203B658E|nr:2,4-dienoyl-CoA reductase [Domibacillus indicus]MCM3787726.1 2,4-dienoyl-CoA reductase [Domibacillus indicus]